jgi:hypothetical protein
MFWRTRDQTLLEKEIDRATRELVNHPIGSQEYVKTLDVIVELHRMKEAEKPSSVSKDTLLIVGANLLSISMIIRAEHVNVISRNAMQMVLRPRV